MIEAGASGVHFEDQLSSAKKMWASWKEVPSSYTGSNK
jgi:2-methylisocitrate lyase-like PEP mutase family enzyme